MKKVVWKTTLTHLNSLILILFEFYFYLFFYYLNFKEKAYGSYRKKMEKVYCAIYIREKLCSLHTKVIHLQTFSLISGTL